MTFFVRTLYMISISLTSFSSVDLIRIKTFPNEQPLHIWAIKQYCTPAIKQKYPPIYLKLEQQLKKRKEHLLLQLRADITFLFFLRFLFSFFFSRYFCHGVRLSFPSNLFLTISSAFSLRPSKNKKINRRLKKLDQFELFLNQLLFFCKGKT